MSEDAKPITPDQADEALLRNIPPFVVEIVNALISSSWDGRSACLKQDDIIARILSRAPEIGRQGVFSRKWLDFEPLFRSAGWVVTYDKPSIGEDYPASFKFKRPS